MKGLSFSETMVKAWMECRKSVTRRLIKKANHPLDGPAGAVHPAKESGYIAWWPGNVSPEFTKKAYAHGFKPPYLLGETVYIKEAGFCCHTDGVRYKADGGPNFNLHQPWKSPRFMPEWASRSHALIVSARPERVQEITPEEVKKEGLVVQDFAGIGVLSLLGLTPETYMESVAMQKFEALWESIHPGSWERNDWVWRIELEKLP